jgi:C-terminal processing protease CtpA/Prc
MRRATLYSLLAIIAINLAPHLGYASPPSQEVSPPSLTIEQRTEDFDYLFKILSEHYPYIWVKQRLGYGDWRSKAALYYKSIIDADSPAKFYSAISQMMKGLHNWHSTVMSKRSIDNYIKYYDHLSLWKKTLEKALPMADFWNKVGMDQWKDATMLRSFYLGGNYYMAWGMRFKDGTSIPVGAVITSLDGMSFDAFVEKNKASLYLIRDMRSGKAFADNLFDAIGGRENVLVSFGGVETRISLKNDDIEAADYCFNHYENPDINTAFAVLNEQGVAYMKIGNFLAENLELDAEAIRQFIEKNNGANAVIIDIRGNSGGDSGYWQDLILKNILSIKLTANLYISYRSGGYVAPFIAEGLSEDAGEALVPLQYPIDVPEEITSGDVDVVRPYQIQVDGIRSEPYPPKIYLLVDREVYSSAEAFAVFVKATGIGTIVGEATGGDGFGMGIVPIVLPNSLLAVKFPADMGLDHLGHVNEEMRTQPDIDVEWTASDWIERCKAEHDGADRREPSFLLEHDPDIKAVLGDLGM